MVCINKSLKEFKVLAEYFNEDFAEALVRAISKEKKVEEGDFYYPSIGEAISFIKNKRETVVKTVEEELEKDPGISSERLFELLKGILYKAKDKYYIVKGYIGDAIKNVATKKFVYDENLNVILSLRDKYPNRFSLKRIPEKDAIEVDIKDVKVLDLNDPSLETYFAYEAESGNEIFDLPNAILYNQIIISKNINAFNLYRKLIANTTKFKNIVDTLNRYTDTNFIYTEEMQKFDNLELNEREKIISDYKKSANKIFEKERQIGRKNLKENNLSENTEYNPEDILKDKKINSQTKKIWNDIRLLTKKLNIKIKFVADKTIYGYDGNYVTDTGEIQINAKILNDDLNLTETIVHEVIHALTYKIIHNVENNITEGLTSTQIKAVRKLRKLYDELKNDKSISNLYALHDIYEFIAHLSNENFSNILRKKDRNFLEKIVDYILDILGIENAEELTRKYLKEILTSAEYYLKREGITVKKSEKSTLAKINEKITPERTQQIKQIFESNPELANVFYEAVGVDNTLEQNINLNDILNGKIRNSIKFVDNIEEVYTSINDYDEIYESISLANSLGIDDIFVIEYFKNNKLKVPSNKIKSKEQLYEQIKKDIHNIFTIENFLAEPLSREKQLKEYEKAKERDLRENGFVSRETEKLKESRYWEEVVKEVNRQRTENLKEWFEYLTKENEVYAANPAFQYLVWRSITKEYKVDKNTYKTQPPVLNRRVLADLYQKFLNKEVLPVTSEFKKFYDNLLVEYNKKLSDIIEVKGKNTKIGEWITIKGEENDPDNFEENVKKLRSLSYTSWCSKTSMAESYLKNGDFYIYIEKDDKVTDEFLMSGKDISEAGIQNVKVGIGTRYDGTVEIQGQANDGIVPLDYYQQIKEFVEKKDLHSVDDRLEKAREKFEKVQKYKEHIKNIQKAKSIEFENTLQYLKDSNSSFKILKNGKIIVNNLRVSRKLKATFENVIELNRIEWIEDYSDINVDELSNSEILKIFEDKGKKLFHYSPTENLYFPDLEIANDFTYIYHSHHGNELKYNKLRIVKGSLNTNIPLPNLVIVKNLYDVKEAPKLQIITGNSYDDNPPSVKYVLGGQDNHYGYANKARIGYVIRGPRKAHYIGKTKELLKKLGYTIESAKSMIYKIESGQFSGEYFENLKSKLEHALSLAEGDYAKIYNIINQIAPEIIKYNWKFKKLIDYTSENGYPKLSKIYKGNIQGFYNKKDGKVYISKNLTEKEKEIVLLHEVIGHKGIEELLSDLEYEEYKNILFSAKDYLYNNAKDLLKRTGHKSISDLAKDYGYDENSEEGQLKIIKELLARQAETNPQATWFERFIGKLQLFLAKTFKISLSKEGVIELLLLSKEKLNNPNLNINTVLNNSVKQEKQAIELFNEYLNSIFPDSKVKDIVYHNTDELFYRFRTIPVAKFFTKSPVGGRKYRIPVLLNISNPKVFSKFLEDGEMTYGLAKRYAKNKERDGIINGTEGKTRTEYIVFEPKQIHILGSKEDIQKAKEFVKNRNKNLSNQIILESVLDKEPISKKTGKVVAEKLSKRFNVPHKFIKAKDIPQLEEQIGQPIGDDTKAFWNPNEGVIYFIEERITEDTPFHEFLHPVVEYIYQYNKPLFDELVNDLNKLENPELQKNYNTLDENKKAEKDAIGTKLKSLKEEIWTKYEGSETDKIKEYLVTVVGLVAAEKLKTHKAKKYGINSLEDVKHEERNIIRKIYTKLLKFIRKDLGIYKVKLAEIPKMTVNELAEYMLAENEKLNLFDIKPKDSIADADFVRSSRTMGVTIDDIKKKFEDPNLEITDEHYKLSNGTLLDRLTLFIHNNFSKKDKYFKKTPAEYKAASFFKQEGKDPNKPGNTVNYNGKDYTYDELVKQFEEDYKIGTIVGTMYHKIIEWAAKGADTKSLMYDEIIRMKDLLERYWVKLPLLTDAYNNIDIEKIKEILDRLGLVFTGKYADHYEPELTVFDEDLGIGTTIDALIRHADGTYSILDFKTGQKFFSDQGITKELLKYAEDLYHDFPDTKLSRAKLEIAFRAFILKKNFPSIRFRDLAVAHINNQTVVESFDVELDSALTIIERFYKEKYKNETDKFEELNKLKLFDSTEYYGSNSLVNDVDIEEKLEDKSYEEKIKYVENKIEFLQSISKMGVRSRAQKEELAKLSLYLLQLRSSGEKVNEIPEKDLGGFRRLFGSYFDANIPILQSLMKLFRDKKNKAQQKIYEMEAELDHLMEKVKKEYFENNPTRALLNKGIAGGLKYFSKQQDGSGIFDFMWVYREKEVGSGYYMITENDPQWNDLTEAQKAYVKKAKEIMHEQWKQTMVYSYVKTRDGKIKNKAEAMGYPQELPEDFMPRIAMNQEEMLEHYPLLSKETLDYQYRKALGSFLDDPTYNTVSDKHKENYNIAVKYMGNNTVIAKQNHSFNAHDAIKLFTKNLINKREMDSTVAVAEGIIHYLQDIGYKRYNDPDYFKKAQAFILDQILIQAKEERKETSLSRKNIRIPGTNKEINAEKAMANAKAWVSASTMWFQPVAGTFNTFLILLLNLKDAVINDLSKLFGHDYSKYGRYGIKEFLWSIGVWGRMQFSSITNDEEGRKLKEFAKMLNYLPDNYDYAIRKKGSVVAKNKLMDVSYLYFFHQIGEDFGTYTILASQLKTIKTIDKNGNVISMWDAYEFDETGKLVYVGGKRGVDTKGQEIAGLTSEEISRMKEVSRAIHGAYRNEEKTAMELTALGQWVMQFRKFVPTQILNAYGSMHKSTFRGYYEYKGKNEKGEDIYEWQNNIVEGRIRTFLKVIFTAIRLKNDPNYRWTNLSYEQKRNLADIAATSLFFILALASMGIMFDDDDEDTQAYKRMNKLALDLTTSYHPLELLNNITNFTAVLNKGKTAVKGFGSFLLEGILEGKEAAPGVPKGLKPTLRHIPLVNGWYQIQLFLYNDSALTTKQKESWFDKWSFDEGR